MPMFGLTEGFRSYDKDRAELMQLAAQTQLTRAQVPHQQALTDLNRAQADQMRAKARLDQGEADAMARVAAEERAGGPGAAYAADQEAMSGGRPAAISPLDMFTQESVRLLDRGKRLMAAGAYTRGLKTIEEASQIHTRAAQAESNMALTDRRKAEASLKLADRMGEIWAGVDTPEAHDAAKMTWRNDPMLRDQPLPAGLRGSYDPREVDRLLRATKAFSESRKETLAQAAEQRLAAEARSRDALRKVQRRVLGEAQELRERTEDRRGREGGGGAKYRTPTAGERDFAERTLRGMGYNPVDEETGAPLMQEYRFRFADRARDLMSTNRALNFEKAFGIVVQEAQESGEIPEAPAKTQPKPGFTIPGIGLTIPLPGGKKTDTFDRSRAPGAPAKPLKPSKATIVGALALPDDPTKLVTGQAYKGKSGVIKIFNGSTFVTPPAAEEGEE